MRGELYEPDSGCAQEGTQEHDLAESICGRLYIRGACPKISPERFQE